MHSTQRAHILIPLDLLREIDEIVGPRGRSAFLLETAREEVRRRKLLRFLENDAPAWREQDHPELANGSDAWVRNLRSESDMREAKPRRRQKANSRPAKPPLDPISRIPVEGASINQRMRLLLDTSVLIDALRSRRARRHWLAEQLRSGYSLETSALNIAEVYAGMRPEEETKTKAFLGALLCHPVTASAGEKAGSLKNLWARKGRTLTLADTIIAAIAMEQDCSLVTDNRKDFPMPEIRLHNLPE